jgi:glycine amidinotransferase
MATNAAGIEWLRRHFTDHRIQTVTFDDLEPVHIDATFVPLRPGLVLSNPIRPLRNRKVKEHFEKNGWEIIDCVKPVHTEKMPLSFCSQWLSMNMLVLDPKTVCVETQEVAQMEQLDKLGFEVIPVPFWEVSPFGGGLHCATADVYREGTCEDYFPKEISS